jgi:hypothetical protein
MSETTNAGKIGALARISAALAANATDIPHLEGPRGRLDQILAEVLGVAQQQTALTAAKQEATRRLTTLITEGERVAEGIRRFLKEHYGLRSEKLAEFGMQPFRGRRRKESPPPEKDAAQPVPTPASLTDSR